jgi:hypothetical protein
VTNESNQTTNECDQLGAQRREALRTTPLIERQDSTLLEKLGVELSFPEAIGRRPRLRLKQRDRIIKWTGEQWRCFEKEGVRWYPEPFVERDYKVLERILAR